MFGATMMGGPCYINDDANSTTLNPWSFNNEANVLYIDQPVQTGFSYDVLINGTLDQLQQPGGYSAADFSSGVFLRLMLRS
jgi:carboxypeptidase C (cathepsin A)